MTKPKVFFGSSSEASGELEALATLCSGFCTPEVWSFDYAEKGVPFLDTLLKRSADVEHAVLLVTPDDELLCRGKGCLVPRDNIVFELGYFIARLGLKRTFAVTPRAPRVKFPSDYAQATVIEFDRIPGASDGVRRVDSLRGAALELKQAMQANPPKKSVAAAFGPAHAEAGSTSFPIPIFRDGTLDWPSSVRWYEDLERDLSGATRKLDSTLLYSGPGLAESWRVRCKSPGADSEMRHAFERHCKPLLQNPPPGEGLNVVDIGIGDFGKGRKALKCLLARDPRLLLNYFALDISDDMIALAVGANGSADPVLRQVAERGGRIAGIHATLAHVHNFRPLLDNDLPTLFLFLGNTLGNQASDSGTLRVMRSAMRPGNRMLVEVQLVESTELPSDATVVEALRADKPFYAGPFLALGIPPSDLDLSVHSDWEKRAGRVHARTYTISCEILNQRTVSHPRFSGGPLTIDEGHIPVYTVRKYLMESIEALFAKAELRVIESSETPVDSPGRRFAYLLAEVAP